MTEELKQAAQAALDQLEFLNACYPHKTATDAADALRRALTQSPAPGVPTLSKDQIREVFLSHGFTVKDGQTDLKPYVYDAADALLKLAYAALAQPAEGGEAAHIEVVGKVVEREDGNEVLWSIEGGIEAIPAGMVLLISDRPVTDDNGHGEVYTTPPASLEQAQQPEPIQTAPSFAQLKQILDNLDRCHTRDSKAEFLRTWIRDWTRHKIEQRG